MRKKRQLGNLSEKELAAIRKMSDVAKERFYALDRPAQKRFLKKAERRESQEKIRKRNQKRNLKKTIREKNAGIYVSVGVEKSRKKAKQAVDMTAETLETLLAMEDERGNDGVCASEQAQSVPANVTRKTTRYTGRSVWAVHRLPERKHHVIRTNRKKKTGKEAVRKNGQVGKTACTAAKTGKKVFQSVSAAAASINPLVWIFLLAAILLCVLLFIIFAVGAGSQTEPRSYQAQVSAETERYRAIVEKYCGKYGIDDYVDLVLAVIEQESGGKGVDVMQTEQSYYNKNPPIDTAEESIDCGVHELSDCLTKSSVESPSDISVISLALQGYNFGNGYIDWAVKNYGGYSADNAKIFSAKMCSSLHLSSYGDVEYVPHVLRYYVENAETKVTNKKAAALLKELKENNTASDSVWNVIERGASLTGTVTYGMLDPPRQDDGRDSPTVLDCSSFAAWSFHKSGYTGIPYASTTKTFAESLEFETISSGNLKVGDIGLKSATAPTGGANHIGIYCGKLKNGTKVWLHCTSDSGHSLTGNSSGVLMSSYTNFTYFRRLKKWI